MSWLEEFGTRAATPVLGQRFLAIVSERDAKTLRQFVTVEHRDIIWGQYTRDLSLEDRRWVSKVLGQEPPLTPRS